jgi:hypothetical protein
MPTVLLGAMSRHCHRCRRFSDHLLSDGNTDASSGEEDTNEDKISAERVVLLHGFPILSLPRRTELNDLSTSSGNLSRDSSSSTWSSENDLYYYRDGGDLQVITGEVRPVESPDSDARNASESEPHRETTPDTSNRLRDEVASFDGQHTLSTFFNPTQSFTNVNDIVSESARKIVFDDGTLLAKEFLLEDTVLDEANGRWMFNPQSWSAAQNRPSPSGRALSPQIDSVFDFVHRSIESVKLDDRLLTRYELVSIAQKAFYTSQFLFGLDVKVKQNCQ